MAGHKGIHERVTEADKRIWDRSLVKAREALDDGRRALRRGDIRAARKHTHEVIRHLTPHDRAVDRANIGKAHAREREKGQTPKQRAASMRNLRKAQQARREMYG